MTAALLLLAGGLGALQAATLLAALPFCFIMLMLAIGLIRQTNADLAGITLSDAAPAVGERLRRLLVPARRDDILRQLRDTGEPALRSVYEALREEGWTDSELVLTEDAIALSVGANTQRAFSYRLTPRSRPLAAYTALEASEARRSVAWFLAAQSSVGTRARDLTDLTVEQVKADVVAQLERWRLG